MFKKTILLIIISLFLVGCNSRSKTLQSDINKDLEEVINFKTESIVLSKGFQAIEPNVETKREGENIKLILTAGVIECSGINIDKITKTGNIINIYISSLFKKDKIQLAIPQATILIEDPINANVEDLSFNIIPQNYENISFKYNKTQIIDKICGEFKIEANTIPEIELIKKDDNIQWNIFFTNLIHKDNYESPLFNLEVYVDAITGETINYKKDIISSYIDQGILLDYLPNKLVLYKKLNTVDETAYESLWCYDVNSGEKTKIYTTKNTIQNAYFNSTGEFIGLIEKNKFESDTYLIEMGKNMAYKITPPDYFNTKLLQWKNEEEICIADISNNMTTIFNYNIIKNETSKIFETNKIIDSFDVFQNMIVFSESDELAINKNIFILEKGVGINQIGVGFKPSFLNDNNIIYIKDDEDMNKNMLKIYDIEKNTVMNILDHNIVNYYKIDDDNILFIEDTNLNNKYNLIKYNLSKKSIDSVYIVNSPTLFYDLDKEKAYISMTISSKDENINNIYSLDLSKIKISN